MDIQMLKYIYCGKFTCTILGFQHKCHLGLLIALVKLGLKVDLVVPSRKVGWSHSRKTWWAALPDFLFCFPIAFSHLSPHWAYTGRGTNTPCACWCSPAQADREFRCWLSLGPAWGKGYQVYFDTLQYPVFIVVVGLPISVCISTANCPVK